MMRVSNVQMFLEGTVGGEREKNAKSTSFHLVQRVTEKEDPASGHLFHKFGVVPLYNIGEHSLASLGSIEENWNSIACLNRLVLTSRGHSVRRMKTVLVSHVCVFVCVCVDVCADLWSFLKSTTW